MSEYASQDEWRSKAKELSAAGLSSAEIKKQLGIYKEGGKEWTIHKKGNGITFVDQVGRRARGARRTGAGKEQDAQLLDTLKIAGLGNAEANGILKEEKAGYKRIEHQARELNKVHGAGSFNVGHETAAIKGGGDYGRNARLEIGKSRVRADGTKMRGNQSRGQLDETPDHLKPVMGIPRTNRGGRDTALYNLLERDVPGIMDLGLTPYDRQEIKKDPASSDDIVTQRQEQLSRPKPVQPRIQPQQGLAIVTKEPPPKQTTALPQPQVSPPTPTQGKTPKHNPKPLGGYQGRAPGGWQTPPVTRSAPPPQNTNWGNTALSILGGIGAAISPVMKSLLIGSPLLR